MIPRARSVASWSAPSSTIRACPTTGCCAARSSGSPTSGRRSSTTRSSPSASSRALSNALANGLRELGVGKGDRVALFMTNRPEYLISFEATSKVGGVGDADQPRLPRATRSSISSTTREARVLIVHEERCPIVDAIRSQHPDRAARPRDRRRAAAGTRVVVRDRATAIPATPPAGGRHRPRARSDRPALLERHHRPAEGRDAHATATWCATTSSARRRARITERDVLLLFLPFYHIYGTMLMGASIASGATRVHHGALRRA